MDRDTGVCRTWRVSDAAGAWWLRLRPFLWLAIVACAARRVTFAMASVVARAMANRRRPYYAIS